jgi:SAM-dependent methyltransferase
MIASSNHNNAVSANMRTPFKKTQVSASTMSRVAAATAVLIAFVATYILSPPSTTAMSLLSTWFQRSLAKNLRAPEGNFNVLGWVAARIMKTANVVNSHEMIDIMLQSQQNNLHISDKSKMEEKTVWVELGPGNGISMEYLLQKLGQTQNLEIHAFEISERFRTIMQTKFASDIASGLITLHGDDAKDIVSVFQHHSTSGSASSVNAIYGTNVVYFLHPLHEYLEVFYNILRPGGLLLFGVQNTVQRFANTTEFANIEWDQVLQEMRKAGFDRVEQRASVHPGETKKTFYLMGFKSLK